MLRHVTRTSVRLAARHPKRLFSAAASSSKSPDDASPPLLGQMALAEGKSWVTMLPHRKSDKHLSRARAQSRKLRLAGKVRNAHSLLIEAGAHKSHDGADLLELLLVLLKTDEFKGPRERLGLMVRALRESPADTPKAAYNVILTACANEASLVSDNSSVKRDVILKTARSIWGEMLRTTKKTDPKNIALMYRLLGHCKDLETVRKVRRQVNDPILEMGDKADRGFLGGQSSEDATAAYILCLGECGRASEAEHLYFSPQNSVHRTSDKVLSALFQAYTASNRISKAESLIAMYGSGFLSAQSCNAFVKQCASLRMHETALEFVDRMSRSDATGFPQPNARTYNLLLRGLSAGTGTEDRDVAADRALAVVEQMKEQGIKPTTVTCNTLIRSFVFREQITEAFDLYHTMDAPNRITFSHLMQGAANVGDLELANEVFYSLVQAGERPNYGFFKSYLEITAKVNGINAAFLEAARVSEDLGEVLVFGDVCSQEVIRMALISACGKVGNVSAAFDALKLKLTNDSKGIGDLAPLYVATVLMQVCLQCYKPGRALEVFYSLKAANLEPNFEVYESLTYGLCSYIRNISPSDAFDETQQVHQDFEVEESNEDPAGFPLEPTSMNGRSAKLKKSRTRRPRNVVEDITEEKALQTAVELLCEMHSNGQGRTVRQAAYVYNALISAAAEMGAFELALQIFNKMNVHSNRGVVYFSASNKAKDGKDHFTPNMQQPRGDDAQQCLAGLVSTGMFESGFEFPAATVGTYNSVINAAWRCGEAWFCLEVFDMMQTNRSTEPNTATLSLLADICLTEAETLGTDGLRKILRELDGVQILSEEVSRKRVRLRQKLLALRWSQT